MEIPGCTHTTVEIDHDHDLKALAVYSGDTLLGVVYPDSLASLAESRAALANGDCPVCGRWEDGLGNTCSEAGWPDPT